MIVFVYVHTADRYILQTARCCLSKLQRVYVCPHMHSRQLCLSRYKLSVCLQGVR